MTELGPAAIGCDISPGLAAEARRAFPELQFQVGALAALDIADSSIGESSPGRMRRLADRFGPIGLGLVGPLFPGVIVTSLSAAALGLDRRRVAFWMTLGIVVWSAFFTAAWSLVETGLVG